MVNQVSVPPTGRTLRVTYWIVTVLLSLNLFAGVFDILLVDAIRQSSQSIGFPLTMLPLLGSLKIAGALVILFVRNPVLKIAAYAGVIFYFIGATYAHVSVGQPVSAALPALITLALSVASYALWQRVSGVHVKAI
ncbi:DoxX family protein [Fibrisoma montanum]|uniref:DoxX family protein n=1 Tax=Fibrisoma montanum TaxID=2305895 RepID=A0A418MHI1_9BACT|nr:DoxX family protein [Fibrisoma montanum]RIV26872.1 DoxX family protein [Fibrisoma montanum]